MNENSIGQIISDHAFKLKTISAYDKKVLKNIIECRTEAIGSRIEKCDCCGSEVILYNSCRNRNCPNCQGSQGFRWLYKRLNEALPVQYYHGVFTIPKELRGLFLYNKKVCLNILFKSVSKTLQQVAKRGCKFLLL
ncbi:MAG TPA: IS91 family transposase, partial [Spirochaetia bacterium]|nr:IS91 family transposase [Spirochaetia bacterium]HBI36387.1 IS91 family transposase [Spirochaetia bacterium]